MRTLVDIPEEDLKLLNERSVLEGLSRAEIVRRAIRESLVPYRRLGRVRGFALWKSFSEDGDVYQERIRAEWDR